jgi:hypothetical protein
VVQSIARVSAGLEITQLELMTMAFVVCALAMYSFWWNKPFDAEREIILTCRNDIQASGYRTKRSTNRETDLDFDKLIAFLVSVHDDDITILLPCVALYATGIVFSALHIAAWNWEFPSQILQTVWRILAVIASGAALAPTLTLLSFSIIDGKAHYFDMVMSIFMSMDAFLWIVYVISRLGLIVLVFYCFSSMPASVYKTVDWTNFLPHFS